MAKIGKLKIRKIKLLPQRKINNPKIILKTNQDIADYGRLRAMGKSSEDALNRIHLSKILNKRK